MFNSDVCYEPISANKVRALSVNMQQVYKAKDVSTLASDLRGVDA